MWLSLEVIILPFLYVVGYEMLMDKQKREVDAVMYRVISESTAIESENVELKNRLNTIKKIK